MGTLTFFLSTLIHSQHNLTQMSNETKSEEKETKVKSGLGTKGGTDEEIESSAFKKKKDEPKCKLKKGDYTVQVYVIEARDLVGVGGGNMADPVCRVEVMGKKYATQIVKRSLSVLWDEIFVFELRGKELDELRRASIKFSVYDANAVRSDVLIGSFTFDLSEVYHREHHEILKQWVALMNPHPKFRDIQGYLKCSAIVLGPD